jgi:hypothetical protein
MSKLMSTVEMINLMREKRTNLNQRISSEVMINLIREKRTNLIQRISLEVMISLRGRSNSKVRINMRTKVMKINSKKEKTRSLKMSKNLIKTMRTMTSLMKINL